MSVNLPVYHQKWKGKYRTEQINIDGVAALVTNSACYGKKMSLFLFIYIIMLFS